MDESVVTHFEQRQVELKPSEAMRLGALFRPQCFGVAYETGSSCALGALAEARGHIRGRGVLMAWYTDLPGKLIDQVVTLNDRDRWPREKIADWLEAKGY